MEKINIRPAIISDVAQLSVLFKQVYMATYGVDGVTLEFTNFINDQFSTSKIEADIAGERDDLWVATYKNNPVGVLQVEYNKPCPIPGLIAPEINKLYILRRFFGQGIGQQLMQEAENQLKEQNEKRIWLWVWSSNKRAIDFYTKLGYADIGRSDFQMEVNTYENTVMRKNL